MAAEQRKLLEQLMGGSATTRAGSLSMTDPKVCRSFLAGTCPHDLFTNTKQDLGPCPKQHSEALKAEYEALSDNEKKKYGFEYDYMRDLQKYIEDCNRRIETAQRRLEKTPDEIRQTNALLKSISELSATISSGTLEVEILGEMGEVSRAIDEFYRVRQAQQTKLDREKELKALSDTSGPSGHQKLQVCDVCGAYLSRLDNDRRLADHFYGKMHLGYAQMRKTYDAFPKEMRRMRAPPQDDDGMGPGGPRGPRSGGGGGGYRGRGGRGRLFFSAQTAVGRRGCSSQIESTQHCGGKEKPKHFQRMPQRAQPSGTQTWNSR
ncbi:U1 snRNP-associated protein usp106 [Colletotrichum orbiculare MAFF 240422]|uniref:U1 snRNP-associated protein usp106 n=1 Tax=Colletotrichum orbiculare (strain 104-T / ATCC 96160 / CBS 514.97 / LARS 414 / MAFF 240422) TaxID=1213857 RepID=A0A484FG26_COLOR|nr:U1 snRNP-associated protein usp106 [Colletotrichum orbiculare MAFF 240422]